MNDFMINNYTAEVTRTGLENNQLPENDNLYSYFSVKEQNNQDYFLNNWKQLFNKIHLDLLQDLAKNNWKNRNRMSCINEFIENVTKRDF